MGAEWDEDAKLPVHDAISPLLGAFFRFLMDTTKAGSKTTCPLLFEQNPLHVMKPKRSNRFFAVAAVTLFPACLFAADRVRNNTANPLSVQDAWDDGASGIPSAADRAVWNGTSVAGATTLGANASWSGILISSATPTSSPAFSNAANASPFTLTIGASGIDLNNGGVTNRGISFDTNTSVLLGANQTWKLGDGQGSANIVVSSVLSGSSSLSITRTSGALNYAQLGGLNTFSGGLTVDSNAWLRLSNSSAATTSGTTVTASPTGTTTLTLNDGALISSDGGTGRVIANTQINLLGNVTFNQAAGSTGRVQVAGLWDLGGASRTITINKPSTSFASGQEGLSFITPASFIAPRVQNGALSFATTSGTTANPAIFRFTTTAFSSNGALTIGDGVAVTSQNGAFFSAGADAPALTLAAADTRGGGVLQLGDGSNVMRGATVYSLAGGGTVSAANTSTGTPVGTITVNNGNGAVFSGTISQGGTGTIAFTKTGAGTQTLSGTNSYTGKTTISAGVLKFGKQVSLYNNTPASWTDTSIQVDSAAVLALNVGGTGEFTPADVASLTALGTATGGFRTGSRLGLDTTNAGGSFTYGNVLANPNAGANALGLRKLGTGTLVLSQVNTYTGGTVVEGGTLKIVQPGGIHTAGLVLNPGTSFDADFSALVAAGQITNSTTGTGTIIATPPNASQLSFTSGTLTGFAGTIQVKPSPASSGRVDFNGLIGTGSTLNVEAGGTARLANSGTYTGLTVNLAGTGGSGPGALRLESGTLDSLCAVNLLANASIGGFTVTSTVDAVVADGGNGFSLTKVGDSTLVLTANNTYTGDTNVNSGTLRISKPYLADGSDVFIGATAVLNLNFDETSGQVSDTVATLTIGTTQMAAGTYGATGSGAANIDDSHFAGLGTLTVLSGPTPSNNYASWALANNVTGGANGDSDNDGVSNLVEYALVDGGERGSYSGNTITFTKRGAPYGNDITYVIETSETLATGSWTSAVSGGSATEISYLFTPGSPAKKFARLKVEQVTP
jgi:autotransporter-associated beta strand protein